jgi:regulator of G-protein signaling
VIEKINSYNFNLLKMEQMIEKMQEDSLGIPIRTVKSFMSKIPSVFIGSDLIQWLQKRLNCDDASKYY